MKSTHAGMGITEAHFNTLVEDLVKSLDKYQVPSREQNELLGALGPMKGDIVSAGDSIGFTAGDSKLRQAGRACCPMASASTSPPAWRSNRTWWRRRPASNAHSRMRAWPVARAARAHTPFHERSTT
jgi:hypothetical protein